MIITEHDDDQTLPHDLQVLRPDVFEQDYEFIVRLHTDNGDSTELKQELERVYFQKPCPHGIVVVVPYNPMLTMMSQGDASKPQEETNELIRQGLDMGLRRLLAEEQAAFQRALGQMQGRRGHHHHH